MKSPESMSGWLCPLWQQRAVQRASEAPGEVRSQHIKNRGCNREIIYFYGGFHGKNLGKISSNNKKGKTTMSLIDI